MRLQNIFMIVALVALAALVGLVVRSVMAPPPRATEVTNVERSRPASSDLPQIYVARETMDVGAFVNAADLEAHDWPSAALLPVHLKVGDVDPNTIAGAVVRDKLIKGEPVLMEKLVRPGERGFLAAVLLPGMRAVSVGVDAVSAHSGLILPGDRVDIILTQDLSTSSNPSRSHVGETIVKAARVLAVGSQLTTPEDSAEVDDKPRTVTLEVTPRQAEVIAVATTIGTLSLSLRSLPETTSDAEEDAVASTSADLTKPDGPTWADDVSKALGVGSGNLSVMRGSDSRSTE